jgi:DNA-binding response OmpR family regulator
MNQAKKESVLLIEGRPADAQLITNALQNKVHEGLDVECVKKLSDGLELIQKGKVRAVIVDIEMPNGRGVCRRLRKAACRRSAHSYSDTQRHGKREPRETGG